MITASCIYEIVAPNGHRYIGSARNFDKRRRGHLTALRHQKHHSRALQRAWNKYGDFVFRPIVICREQDLFFYEQICLDNLRPEYNVSPSASGTRGLKWTEESRKKKIGVRVDGRKISDGMMAAMSPSERKERAKKARSSWSQASLASYAITRKANGRSEASKKKASDANKASWKNPEIRKKRIERMKAAIAAMEPYRHSDSAKKKMRDYWARRRAINSVDKEVT